MHHSPRTCIKIHSTFLTNDNNRAQPTFALAESFNPLLICLLTMASIFDAFAATAILVEPLRRTITLLVAATVAGCMITQRNFGLI